MKHRSFLYISAVLTLVMSTILPLIPARQAAAVASGVVNGKILFTKRQTGQNVNFYTMNHDGTNSTQISVSSPATSTATLGMSPDGRKVVFSVDDGGAMPTDLYVMNIDGSGATRLTNTAADFEDEAVWAPDGSKIAFTKCGATANSCEIYTINPDGSNLVRLTNNVVFDGEPAWSPDGSKIAFRTYRDSDNEIYTMNADGTVPTRLTNSVGDDGRPAWSPDGTKIAFDSGRSGGGDLGDIYVMNAAGSGVTRLTTDLGQDYNANWSPDGSKIIFVSNRSQGDIYTMNPDGSGQTDISQITNVDTHIDNYAWQPLVPETVNGTNGSKVTTVEADRNLSALSYTVTDKETLIVKGQIGAVTVQNGGIIKGTGTVGAVSVAGGTKFAPGLSPGCINTGDLTFVEGSTYEFEVGGTTECTEYDQTRVTGTVNLGNGTLSFVRYNGFKPVTGQSYKIIDNDGSDAVTGTFKDLPEGATFTVDGYVLKISYVGGDGNDVVLTVQSVPAVPDTGFKLLQNNPVATLISTTMLAGAMIVLAKKYQAIVKK